MEKLCFEDYEELACYICSTYDTLKLDDELSDVAIIAKYEDTRQIIKEILCLGYDIHSISMHDVECDGYDSEYIITLCENELWIEPMLRNDRYITDTSSIIYIFNTCSSKVIPYCKGDIVYEISIGDEGCGCDECCYCCECDEDDTELTEDTHGFTVSNSDENGYYSYSFYSTDKNLVAEMAKRFK